MSRRTRDTLHSLTWLLAAALLTTASCPLWGRAQVQRIPRQAPARPTGAIQLFVHDPKGGPIPGVPLEVEMRGGYTRRVTADAQGIVRLTGLPPGRYRVTVRAGGFAAYESEEFQISAGESLPLAITLTPQAAQPQSMPPWRGVGPAPIPPVSEYGPYRELPRNSQAPPETTPVPLPPAGSVFVNRSDRWDIPVPLEERHARLERKPSRFNPFARSKWKGDEPILGDKTFFDFTLVSDSEVETRRLPVPSPESSATAGTPGFFGKGGQLAYPQYWRFSFDLFHGDAAYKPVDWRIRITPVANINYLSAQETQVTNFDVTKGTSRFDGHVGLQEAFGEVKLRDLSPNYDFLSVRAGIQQFTSDFRGLLFVEEQPGVRFFGNLRSNRIEYNAAYFYFLEKDTNSELNTFQPRHQQVALANLFIQDFLWKGYTTQFSFHYNQDNADIHFDTNNFRVRPAVIGIAQPHTIHAYYLGWTGNGHIHRVNLSHAFYQALGHDDLNPIAGRPTSINAQLGFLELSLDKDWARFKVTGFFASGDRDPRDGTARGFDTIVDQDNFAGGVFSLWNREGIRLTGSDVQLVTRDSFLPSLRSSKFEGQANFVNPGLLLLNAGSDLEVTTKLRALLNVNFMRFEHTQPLELVLNQRPIHAGIGADYSLGLQYRPFLSDNLIVTGGASALSPFQGFKDIYFDHTLFSLFANVRLKF
ncbi:MAG TPA: carboxypeptidase-like regulatory domain-containing protein [Terriglobales bacterium]|jgi:hypothetical protein|nr:carboxypeptidase-like regulatory domain-containing protein [Terriglobales bacterium]